MHRSAQQLAEAEDALSSFEASSQHPNPTESSQIQSLAQVHTNAAQKLVTLCRQNGGVYIKIGQHLANLDHLLPQPYLTALASLYNQAPTSSVSSVYKVIRDEFGQDPNELWDDFEEVPIASASLAQVHVARDKITGQKLAIKVQHLGLRETSRGDLWALEYVVRLIDNWCEDFTVGWLVEEISPNLPKELDFVHEGRNAELAAKHLEQIGLGSISNPNCDVIVPKVHWKYTTQRVLCMDFEHGYEATDLDAMKRDGIAPRDLSKLISNVFQSQVFSSGFVHCDPHPANVMWRRHPYKRNRPQLVLVDHGLYKQLDDDFRITYAQLWKALLLADISAIRSSCRRLLSTGNGNTNNENKLYPLLAAMLTSRPFDEIVQRSKTQSLGRSPISTYTPMDSKSDTAMIRGYAQQYLPQIIAMLDQVPRQMLLLFKLNDCLRHLDLALGSSPTHSLLIAGRYAAKAVYEHEKSNQKETETKQSAGSKILRLPKSESTAWKMGRRFQGWFSYVMTLSRIRVYEMVSHYSHMLNSQKSLLQG